MALGESSIREVMGYCNDIDTALGNDSGWPGMLRSWETFNWVSQKLGEWADEATIGKELQTEMIQLADALKLLIDRTQTLNLALRNFTSKQRKLNNIQF